MSPLLCSWNNLYFCQATTSASCALSRPMTPRSGAAIRGRTRLTPRLQRLPRKSLGDHGKIWENWGKTIRQCICLSNNNPILKNMFQKYKVGVDQHFPTLKHSKTINHIQSVRLVFLKNMYESSEETGPTMRGSICKKTGFQYCKLGGQRVNQTGISLVKPQEHILHWWLNCSSIHCTAPLIRLWWTGFLLKQLP